MVSTMNPQYPSASVDSYSPDRLIAGVNIGPVTDGGTLVSGQNLIRGALLGKITASGKLTLALSASSDGSQTPYAILAEDTNASAGDAACTIYTVGEFNPNAMTFGTGITAASAKDTLRDAGIILKTYLPAASS
jgi:hypothetical protein